MMQAASWPRPEPLDERLLVVDTERALLRDAHVRDLPTMFEPGDALIVNDAATLPASLQTSQGDLEVRLASHAASDAFVAVLLGPGDYRTPTEARPWPRAVAAGERLDFGAGLSALIVAIDPEQPRLVTLRFEQTGAALYRALYRQGRPIQYAYVKEPLPLFHVQSRYAGVPWAFESPSAGRPITFGALRELLRRGVHLGHVTHAAGISSTGSLSLDARFPLAERYAIHDSAVRAVHAARRDGGRVIAAGTTVTRALEASALAHGGVVAGQGVATLRLGPRYRLRVVGGIFTGMHAPGTSHFELLEAFAPRALLERMDAHAGAADYLGHELGDSCLIAPRVLAPNDSRVFSLPPLDSSMQHLHNAASMRQHRLDSAVMDVAHDAPLVQP